MTESGAPESLSRIYDLLSDLKCKWVAIPGNHDYGAHGCVSDVENPLKWDHFATVSWKAPENGWPKIAYWKCFHIVGLNSMEGVTNPVHWSTGTLGERQLSHFIKQCLSILEQGECI